MALIRCPECYKEISDKASICPVCGFPMEVLDKAPQTRKMRCLIDALCVSAIYVAFKWSFDQPINLDAFLGIFAGTAAARFFLSK